MGLAILLLILRAVIAIDHFTVLDLQESEFNRTFLQYERCILRNTTVWNDRENFNEQSTCLKESEIKVFPPAGLPLMCAVGFGNGLTGTH